jgi:ligand-binding sensor domain-containing protein
LPQNSATSILQTPDGYLWFGTFNGLVRYDGARFVIYDEANTPELPSSRILQLLLDAKKRLWIISEFGDATLWENGRFTRLYPADGEHILKISSLLTTEFGAFFTDNGIIYSLDEQTARPLLNAKDLGHGRVVHLLMDKDGVLWLALKQSFGFIQNSHYTQLIGPTGNPSIAPVEHIGLAREGGVWVSRRGEGIHRFQKGKAASPQLKWPIKEVICRDILEDDQGTLWVASENEGLLRRTPQGEWKQYTSTNGLSSSILRTVYKDREGSLWIGTDGGGLDRMRERRVKMMAAGGPKGGNIVTCVAQGNDGAILYSVASQGVFRQREGKEAEILPPTPPHRSPFNLGILARLRRLHLVRRRVRRTAPP